MEVHGSLNAESVHLAAIFCMTAQYIAKLAVYLFLHALISACLLVGFGSGIVITKNAFVQMLDFCPQFLNFILIYLAAHLVLIGETRFIHVHLEFNDSRNMVAEV